MNNPNHLQRQNPREHEDPSRKPNQHGEADPHHGQHHDGKEEQPGRQQGGHKSGQQSAQRR